MPGMLGIESGLIFTAAKTVHRLVYCEISRITVAENQHLHSKISPLTVYSLPAPGRSGPGAAHASLSPSVRPSGLRRRRVHACFSAHKNVAT
ncbi:hypothetical protein EVAR_99717_1 [Eumeta japonica]|uniref:Uncharacterized protein n=1 Tax=Eumeta variegata TaxID=151549 RepID=A0A4C1ZM56_EUMVA|nr:hypothetical protein EVAR_99717_1 [Eumeta japonica]